MNDGKYVLAQVMDHLPLSTLHRCVERYSGEYKVKRFSYLDQYLSMAFAQLTYRESVRDIGACLRTQITKLYQLGFRSVIARNTLAVMDRVGGFLAVPPPSPRLTRHTPPSRGLAARVRHPTGCSFASSCSPPRLTATQLPLATQVVTSYGLDLHQPDNATSRTHRSRALHGRDGRFARLFRTLTKVDLLILDDWGQDRLSANHRRDLMEIVVVLEARAFGTRTAMAGARC